MEAEPVTDDSFEIDPIQRKTKKMKTKTSSSRLKEVEEACFEESTGDEWRAEHRPYKIMDIIISNLFYFALILVSIYMI